MWQLRQSFSRLLFWIQAVKPETKWAEGATTASLYTQFLALHTLTPDYAQPLLKQSKLNL